MGRQITYYLAPHSLSSAVCTASSTALDSING